MKKIKTISLIIILVLVFGLGFMVGHALAIKLCVKIAIEVLEINIDPVVLEQIVIRYGERVADGLYFGERICT